MQVQNLPLDFAVLQYCCRVLASPVAVLLLPLLLLILLLCPAAA
jgi:hypothetical protein